MDISDALSEKDRVKFTVHTVTTLPGFAKNDFCVVRQHEEFVWLHDRIEENDDYGGYIVRYRTGAQVMDNTYLLFLFLFRSLHVRHVLISMRPVRNCNDWAKERVT